MEYLSQISADGGATWGQPSSATRRAPDGFEGELEELGTIQVKPWIDPMVESLGFDPRSTYVEHFWLPVLGPSCIFLLRRIAYHFDLDAEPQELSLKEMSCEIGLGSPKGFGNSITRTLNRCIQFDMARLLPNGVLTVRRSLPPLSQRQLARLPEELRALHEQLLNGFAEGTAADLRRRSVQLAVSLVDTQADESEAVEALLRWRINSQVAAEALQVVWPR
ncbi:MAG: hypothetical protein M0Z29_03085 [Actinomycetota bacterium]|nr:hypothetical protein [Actinomycetota bacterium]